MLPDKLLQGKVALVTGAGRGIGAEVARLFAQQGATVIVHYHTSEGPAQQLAQELSGLALAADLLIWFVWGPHLPPGTMATASAGQQFDIKVMAVMAAPVMVLVLVYFGYALTVWRQRDGDEEDGPALHGNTRIQATWITVTSVMVLSLFAFGTYELVTAQGAGAGEGPSPIWKPTGHTTLQVQVIGQQ